jgi:hypothetical protein
LDYICEREQRSGWFLFTELVSSVYIAQNEDKECIKEEILINELHISRIGEEKLINYTFSILSKCITSNDVE